MSGMGRGGASVRLRDKANASNMDEKSRGRVSDLNMESGGGGALSIGGN